MSHKELFVLQQLGYISSHIPIIVPSYIPQRYGSDDLNMMAICMKPKPRHHMYRELPGLLMVNRKKPFSVRFKTKNEFRYFNQHDPPSETYCPISFETSINCDKTITPGKAL